MFVLLLLFLFGAFYFFSDLLPDSDRQENGEETEVQVRNQVFKLRSIEDGDSANSYIIRGRSLNAPKETEEEFSFNLSLVDSQDSSVELSDFLVFLGKADDLIDTSEASTEGNFLNYVSRPVLEVIENIDFNLPVEFRLNTKLSQEFIESCVGDNCEDIFRKAKFNEANELILEETIKEGAVLPGNYAFHVYFISNVY